MGLMFPFTPHPPYAAALTFEAARFYAVHGATRTLADGTPAYRRAARVGSADNAVALYELRAVGTVEQPRIEAHVLAVTGAPDQAALGETAARLVQPQVDPRPFYALAEHDPTLAETVHRIHGLRVVGYERLFSALLVTTMEQQISLKSAQLAERWLLQTYGDAITHDGETYFAFPSPARLASLIDEDLRPLKITFIRVNRILALARAVAESALDLEGLAYLPADAAYAQLRQIKGVGHWTAAWAMLRAMGVYLPMSSADVALRSAVNHYAFGQPGRCDPALMDTYLAQHAPHDGWASFYFLTRWALDRY